ncbi:hypothetical protein JCM10449v2_003572 [Rhodotorula kratochvilovae]
MAAHTHDAEAEPPQSPDDLPALHLLSLAADEPASWNSLPVELKQQVIDEVLSGFDEMYEAHGEHEVGYFEVKHAHEAAVEHANDLRHRELQRLQRINREFREIAAPLVWRRLILGSAGKKQLARLEQILPRHATHVRVFSFGDEPIIAYREDDEPTGAQKRARNAIATRLLRRCTRVEEVIVDQPGRQAGGALKLPRLRTATIFPRSFSGREFSFLRQQARLESLAVLSYALYPPDGVDSALLGTHITRFSHLKHLRIDGAGLVSDEFLQRARALQAPLVSLELVSSYTFVSFDVLETFLGQFASTLETLQLALFSGEVEEWVVPDGPGLHLPHLTSLAVGGDFSPSLFLRLVSPCMAITFFRLDLCPFFDLAPFVLFLNARASKLEAVYVSEDALLGNEDLGDEYDELGLDEEDADAIVECCDDLDIAVTLGATFGIEDDEDEDEDEDQYQDPYEYDRYYRSESDEEEWSDSDGESSQASARAREEGKEGKEDGEVEI